MSWGDGEKRVVAGDKFNRQRLRARDDQESVKSPTAGSAGNPWRYRTNIVHFLPSLGLELFEMDIKGKYLLKKLEQQMSAWRASQGK